MKFNISAKHLKSDSKSKFHEIKIPLNRIDVVALATTIITRQDFTGEVPSEAEEFLAKMIYCEENPPGI